MENSKTQTNNSTTGTAGKPMEWENLPTGQQADRQDPSEIDYEPKEQKTMTIHFSTAEQEAIDNANAHMNNTTLPNYSELLELLVKRNAERDEMIKVITAMLNADYRTEEAIIAHKWARTVIANATQER